MSLAKYIAALNETNVTLAAFTAGPKIYRFEAAIASMKIFVLLVVNVL
jgi:hypothetical protein